MKPTGLTATPGTRLIVEGAGTRVREWGDRVGLAQHQVVGGSGGCEDLDGSAWFSGRSVGLGEETGLVSFPRTPCLHPGGSPATALLLAL